MRKKERAKRVWEIIFALKKGDKVRYIQSLYANGFPSPKHPHRKLGDIGRIVEVGIDKGWKSSMVFTDKCFPKAILKEKMFLVQFSRSKVRFAMRRKELERV